MDSEVLSRTTISENRNPVISIGKPNRKQEWEYTRKRGLYQEDIENPRFRSGTWKNKSKILREFPLSKGGERSYV